MVTPDTSVATSSAELLRSCVEIVNMARPTEGGEVNIPSNGLICWYYMSAIQNMSVLEDVHGVRSLAFAHHHILTLMDFVRIFVQKAQKRKMQNENKRYRHAPSVCDQCIRMPSPARRSGPTSGCAPGHAAEAPPVARSTWPWCSGPLAMSSGRANSRIKRRAKQPRAGTCKRSRMSIITFACLKHCEATGSEQRRWQRPDSPSPASAPCRFGRAPAAFSTAGPTGSSVTSGHNIASR
jgi:hypothetical protein